MASGTTAAALQVLPSGYVVNIYVDSVLISGRVPLETIEFEESGNQEIGACRFTVSDPSNSVTVRDKAFLSISDATGVLFKGFVISRVPVIRAIGRDIEVTAEGIESLLDTTIVVSNRRPSSGSTPTESDKSRIQYLLATYGQQRLYNNSFGSTDTSKIQVLDGALPTQKFKNLTLRQSIERVLAVASTTANYYVDNVGRVHTFDAGHPEGDAAPYVVRVGTPGAGEVAPEDLRIDFDSQNIINFYRVIAKVRTADTYVSDEASIAQYGRFSGFVNAPDAETVAKATAVGMAALSDTAQPRARGSFKVTTPYDMNGATRWRVGQMVTLHSTQHGLAGAQSRIIGLTWRYLSGAGDREVSVRFGGDRLRLRSGGTLNNTGSSGDIS